MSRYRYVSPVMNRRVCRPLDRRSLLRWSMTFVIGLTLAAGFGFAAWQQVEARRLNYETNQLRRRLDELRRERARLEVAHQQRLSPLRLNGVARLHNFSPGRPEQMVHLTTSR